VLRLNSAGLLPQGRSVGPVLKPWFPTGSGAAAEKFHGETACGALEILSLSDKADWRTTVHLCLHTRRIPDSARCASIADTISAAFSVDFQPGLIAPEPDR
jgi:hypothetical protein